MAQQRITVFGDLIDTSDLPTMASNIMSPGRLVGMEFTVGAADLLRVTPGTCILPDGVLLLEDEPRDVMINNSSFATDYTIVYQLEDARVLGGSPAKLRILTGTIRQTALTDATIIGWIKYPGGSIPLADSHLIQPSRLRIEPHVDRFSASFVAPFSNAIRPADEASGVTSIKAMPVTNLESSFSMTLNTAGISFGNLTARILGASLLCNSDLPVGLTAYGRYSVKRGPTTLFTFDTRPAYQPSGATSVPSLTPMLFERNPALANNQFIVTGTEAITIESEWTGASTTIPGEITLMIEMPASQKNWSESVIDIVGEKFSRFYNTGSSTQTIRLAQPFVVSGEGQPRKLVAYLSVDFSCTVTFQFQVGTQLVTLSPLGGVVSNTGGVRLQEFNIPNLSNVTWNPGRTAVLLIDITAQPGRSAALGHVSLVQESAPFLLFA